MGLSKRYVTVFLGRVTVEPSRRPSVPLNRIPEEEAVEEVEQAEAINAEVDGSEQIVDPYDQYETNEDSGVKSNKDFEEEEFSAMFEKMCTESIQVATLKSAKSDLPIPMSAASKLSGTSKNNWNFCHFWVSRFWLINDFCHYILEPTTSNGVVNVTLLTKKNNKQKLKTLTVSAEEEFIVSLKTREEVIANMNFMCIYLL